MEKLIVTEFLMQANGGNSEELDPGCGRRGWAIPTGDQGSAAHIASTWRHAYPFLFGRYLTPLSAAHRSQRVLAGC